MLVAKVARLTKLLVLTEWHRSILKMINATALGRVAGFGILYIRHSLDRY